MEDDTVVVSKQYLRQLLAEEKRSISSFQALCQRYGIPVDPTALAVSTERIQILNLFLDAKTMELRETLAKKM
jgi:hypothetical protein